MRTSWKSRYGFYMAAIGSSFGLGNIWRFPYVVGTNGGGAFVSLYLFTALVVGLSLLIAELMLGKVSRQRAVGSLEYLIEIEAGSGRKTFRGWPWFGRLSLFASVLLLSYYAVISGWVLYFLAEAIMGWGNGAEGFKYLMNNGLLQLALAAGHLILSSLIVGRGMQEGSERWVGTIMSLFVILLLFLVLKSLMLPGAPDALRFLLYPDFSKFTFHTLIQVLGHVFFTLSLGLGSMVTFGSYMRADTPVAEEGLRVTAMDTAISLFAGLLIFPIVFSAGFFGSKLEASAGPGLLFETIPLLFSRMGLGRVFEILFFLCLYFAALGATIGLLEGGVSHLADRYKMNRKKATPRVAGAVLAVAVLPALSSSVFRNIKFHGLSLIQILDTILINWVLPISALGLALGVGFVLSRHIPREDVIDEDVQGGEKLYFHWLFALKWITPALIVFGLLLSAIGYFRD